MSNMVLTCSEGGNFAPHPEGIHPAVCVDVVDLGLVETEFQGQKRLVEKVKVVFETEQKTEDGKNATVAKSFSASLHLKSKLTEFLGKWRGRPLVPGETVELARLVGASCTLVVSHQRSMEGRIYASIDAVSKPTKKVTPSGGYDPAEARRRYVEWKTKQAEPARVAAPPHSPPQAAPQRAEPVAVKTAAVPTAAAETESAFDPDVGF